MQFGRQRELVLDICGVALILLFAAIPFVTGSPLLYSWTNQTVIGLTAALGVYIMLRLGLLSFTVPAFMAIGGYAAAIVAVSGTTNLILLMSAACLTPAIFAIPLGMLVLRLKGIYFVFITYILNEILQLVLFETPGLTGGSDGISGVPPASLFGMALWSPRHLVLVTVGIGMAAAVITLAVTHRFRAEFSSIEDNETLAQSLGVAVWKYRTLGLVASAGVSGLAGFALVNQLSTANPSSFSSFSAINYIAYAFIGGRRSLMGAVIGTIFVVVMSNLFSAQGQYAGGLFGLLLIGVVMIAPAGLIGLAQQVLPSRRSIQSKAPTEANTI